MLCFHDQSYCTEETCANFSQDKCFRALTEEVKAQAKIWWGSDDYPIAIFAERPGCYVDGTKTSSSNTS